ncbi:hypothetical protein ACER0C_026980 [Sarotherodon galilaeus]
MGQGLVGGCAEDDGVSVWYIKRGQRPPELGDPYFGCGEQDLIPRTVTSVLVWCAVLESNHAFRKHPQQLQAQLQS